jgi:hypothetical protein
VKLVEIFVGLLFFAALIGGGYYLLMTMGVGDEQEVPEWRVDERSHDGRVDVLCVHPGQEPILVGVVRESDPGYNTRYAKLMFQAASRCTEMNTTRAAIGE